MDNNDNNNDNDNDDINNNDNKYLHFVTALNGFINGYNPLVTALSTAI